MSELVASCEQLLGNLEGKTVLDIGCNDGSLLDYFKAKGAKTVGIEPTDAYLDAVQKGHPVFNQFLSEEVADLIVAAHGKPDLITFTNVFAHIENLHEVLDALRLLTDPETVIVVENHYLGAVLDGNQFDTFYHEHPRTYSYTSFVHLARSLNISVLKVEFPARYGGNIRVFLGNGPNMNDSGSLNQLEKRESRFQEDFAALRNNIERWRESKRRFIERQVQEHGKLRAKAFPGRAAILVKLLGLNEELISAVYEKPGSLKIGHYLPGTRIPICSDEELFGLPDQTQPLLNLAWHIPREIHNYLKEHGYLGPVFDILTSEDFILK
jgi:SAM-dependent methyltransferase